MGRGTASPQPPPPRPALSFSLLPSLGLRHKETSAERERVFPTRRIAIAFTHSREILLSLLLKTIVNSFNASIKYFETITYLNEGRSSSTGHRSCNSSLRSSHMWFSYIQNFKYIFFVRCCEEIFFRSQNTCKYTLWAKYLPSKGQAPPVKKKSSIAMSPVILLPTTPSNVTCQKHGRIAFITDF